MNQPIRTCLYQSDGTLVHQYWFAPGASFEPSHEITKAAHEPGAYWEHTIEGETIRFYPDTLKLMHVPKAR